MTKSKPRAKGEVQMTTSTSAPDFEAAFVALKAVLAKHAKKLTVTDDGPGGYSVSCKSPSPFPQHKGQPLFFGGVKIGKAYVSFHLMPIYMVPTKISPALKKRMQGKACFNFKAAPEKELLDELKALTAAALDQFAAKKWL